MEVKHLECSELLSAKEVAERLKLTPQSVYALIRVGTLHAVKISPRCYRIAEKALVAFLDAREMGG